MAVTKAILEKWLVAQKRHRLSDRQVQMARELGLNPDKAWEEAMTRIQDDPQKNFITIIDIARAGKATKDMVDYIRRSDCMPARL